MYSDMINKWFKLLKSAQIIYVEISGKVYTYLCSENFIFNDIYDLTKSSFTNNVANCYYRLHGLYPSSYAVQMEYPEFANYVVGKYNDFLMDAGEAGSGSGVTFGQWYSVPQLLSCQNLKKTSRVIERDGSLSGAMHVCMQDPFNRYGVLLDTDAVTKVTKFMPGDQVRKLLEVESAGLNLAEEEESPLWAATAHFSTQYFGNIGWYVPNGYVIDPVATALVWQENADMRFSYLVLRTTLSFLDRAMYRYTQVWSQILSPVYMMSDDVNRNPGVVTQIIQMMGASAVWLGQHNIAFAVTAASAAVNYLTSWANYNVSSKVLFYRCKGNAAFDREADERDVKKTASQLGWIARDVLKTGLLIPTGEVPMWTPEDLEVLNQLRDGQQLTVSLKQRMKSYVVRDTAKIYFISKKEEDWWIENVGIEMPLQFTEESPGGITQQTLGFSDQDMVDAYFAGGNTY